MLPGPQWIQRATGLQLPASDKLQPVRTLAAKGLTSGFGVALVSCSHVVVCADEVQHFLDNNTLAVASQPAFIASVFSFSPGKSLWCHEEHRYPTGTCQVRLFDCLILCLVYMLPR